MMQCSVCKIGNTWYTFSEFPHVSDHSWGVPVIEKEWGIPRPGVHTGINRRFHHWNTRSNHADQHKHTIAISEQPISSPPQYDRQFADEMKLTLATSHLKVNGFLATISIQTCCLDHLQSSWEVCEDELPHAQISTKALWLSKWYVLVLGVPWR